jgi:hypothetical protein
MNTREGERPFKRSGVGPGSTIVSTVAFIMEVPGT